MSQGPTFKKLYPDTESIVFDGGKDNKFAPALIPDNESPDCANVVFFDGTVGTRDGAVKLNTAAAGVNPFDGLYTRRDNSGAESLCAFIDGHMKVLGTTTFVTVASAQSVFTIGARVASEMAENYMFIGNGVNGPYKYNGTNFTYAGVSAPTSTITVASATTGSLTTNGNYRWAYTYVNSGLVEGNLSPLTATWTVSGVGLAAALSTVGTAPASGGVVRRRIYRTVTSGSVFFKVADVADNSTLTYTDTTADVNLGAQAPTDNGTPPLFTAIIYLNNILFCNDVNNPNYVWYSVAGQPYTFPSTNFFRVGDRSSDLVKGFGVSGNYLVVFCEKSTWINFMPNPADATGWRQIQTNSPYGSKSPYCILRVENKLLHAAVENTKFVGFSTLAGIALQPTTTGLNVTVSGSDRESDRIEPDMFNVQEAYLSNVSGIVFKTRAYVTVTYGSANTQNNRCYLYDFSISNLKKAQKSSWVPITGWNAQQFAIFGGKLYYASSDSTGFVFQVDGTGVYSDNGTAINSYFWTKEYPGFEEDTNQFKDFRYANILYDMAGSYYMNLTYRVDSDKGSGQSVQINLNPGGSLWGSMMWGRDVWGGGSNQTESRVYLGALRGKRVQLQFSNQNAVGQRFKVHRMNFLYNLKGYR